MNFRLVWVGSDDDPPEQLPSAEKDGSIQRFPTEIAYELRGTRMVRRQQLDNGRVRYTPVANFNARIVREIIVDDDCTLKREFGVEAELGGQRFAFVVSAAEFSRMGWVLQRLGPQAIVYPGQQQHARAAIQWLSGEIRRERIFSHLGWRKYGEGWVYLHAGGALGAQGPAATCRSSCPAPFSISRFLRRLIREIT
jgi:hypothetical protein